MGFRGDGGKRLETGGPREGREPTWRVEALCRLGGGGSPAFSTENPMSRETLNSGHTRTAGHPAGVWGPWCKEMANTEGSCDHPPTLICVTFVNIQNPVRKWLVREACLSRSLRGPLRFLRDDFILHLFSQWPL